MIWIRKTAILRGGDDTPTPAKLLDLNSDEFEVSHGSFNFILPGACDRTMCDEASVVPSGSLVVPSTALLLLAVVVMITIPEIALSLLVAETTTGLISSKVPAIRVV